MERESVSKMTVSSGASLTGHKSLFVRHHRDRRVEAMQRCVLPLLLGVPEYDRTADREVHSVGGTRHECILADRRELQWAGRRSAAVRSEAAMEHARAWHDWAAAVRCEGDGNAVVAPLVEVDGDGGADDGGVPDHLAEVHPQPEIEAWKRVVRGGAQGELKLAVGDGDGEGLPDNLSGRADPFCVEVHLFQQTPALSEAAVLGSGAEEDGQARACLTVSPFLAMAARLSIVR